MFLKDLAPRFEADGGQAGGGQEPAPTPTPEPTPEQPKENMIPKSRFDEVNSKLKEMADKVSAFEKLQADQAKAQEEAERLAKEEQGKFQELYEKANKELEGSKQFQDRVTELEGLIQTMVDAKLSSIPEQFHDLIPSNLNSEQKLDWINKAESKGLFGTPEPKEVGSPSNRSNDKPKVDKANLSPLDKILSGLGGK